MDSSQGLLQGMQAPAQQQPSANGHRLHGSSYALPDAFTTVLEPQASPASKAHVPSQAHMPPAAFQGHMQASAAQPAFAPAAARASLLGQPALPAHTSRFQQEQQQLLRHLQQQPDHLQQQYQASFLQQHHQQQQQQARPLTATSFYGSSQPISSPAHFHPGPQLKRPLDMELAPRSNTPQQSAAHRPSPSLAAVDNDNSRARSTPRWESWAEPPLEGSEHEADSDYELDDGTRFSDEEEAAASDSDGKHPGRARKRKMRSANGRRQAKRLVHEVIPPMNEMREKLRSAAPVDSSPELPSEPPPDLAPEVLLERIISAEEEQVQLAMLRSDYHMAAVLDFFGTFRYAAGLAGLEFEAEALENALVTSPGGPGLLANVHLALLKGISPRSEVTERNWTSALADRLKRGGCGYRPPFLPPRYHEAEAYAALPTPDRVLALNLLCDIRLDREDLRIGIEESLKPPPRPPKAPKALQPVLPKEQPTRSSTRSTRYAPPPPPPPVVERPVQPPPLQKGEILRLPLRKEPMGVDASGSIYWLMDMGRPLGTRVYRELSMGHASAKKAAPKGRGVYAQDPPAATFDLIGSTTEELQAAGERLARSKRKPDQRMAAQLLDVVVPGMVAAAVEEMRQAQQQERLRKQLGTPMNNDGFHGRSRRERKQINYAYNDFDETIRNAIRGRRGEPEPPGRGDTRAGSSDARRGLRRGRSAATDPEEGAEPLLEAEQQLSSAAPPHLSISSDDNRQAGVNVDDLAAGHRGDEGERQHPAPQGSLQLHQHKPIRDPGGYSHMGAYGPSSQGYDPYLQQGYGAHQQQGYGAFQQQGYGAYHPQHGHGSYAQQTYASSSAWGEGRYDEPAGSSVWNSLCQKAQPYANGNAGVLSIAGDVEISE